MLTVSQTLLDALWDSPIRWLLWKGNNHAEDGFCGDGDIDMLVHRDDRDAVHTLLRRLDWIHPQTQAVSRHPEIEDWIGFDRQTGILLHLHLHFQMVFGRAYVNEYTFAPYDVCFTLAQRNGPFRVQHPAVEALLLLCRMRTGALAKQSKIDANKAYLRTAMTKAEFQYAALQCGLSAHGAETVYAAFLQPQTDAGALAPILDPLLKKNCAFPALRSKARFAADQCNRRLQRLTVTRFTKKTLPHGGRSIAFVGQDGAGKSTVTKEITAWLRWKLEARQFYLGSGEHYRSPQRALIRRLPNRGVFRLLVALLVVSDLKHIAARTYRILRKARRYTAHGGIALFDRYPQNETAGINDGPKIRENYLPKAANPLARAYMRFAAKREERILEKAVRITPDLLCKLMLSPEESLRRKPKENLENVTRKHEIIRDQSFGAAQVRVIDASRPYAAELLEIKNIVWDLPLDADR